MSNKNYCNNSDKLGVLTAKLLKENAGVASVDDSHIQQAIKFCCKNGDDNQSDEDFEKCVYNTLGLRY